MTNLIRLFTRSAAVGVLTACSAFGQTSVTGANMAMRSSGSRNTASGTATLDENGYFGTYITLTSPGTVHFAIEAAGTNSPRMTLEVSDSSVGWDVAPTAKSYSTNIALSAGTHFVRTEFTNGTPTAGRMLTLQNLRVSGATISNAATNANAIAAADTYVANYRKGDAAVVLQGLAPGTPVQVSLKRHAFNFGGTVSGVGASDPKSMLVTSNPVPGTEAYKFQEFINRNFNMIVPSNAGKWASNESRRDAAGMSYVDTILGYAQSHNMRARMHNLIWGRQQPAWVTNSNNTGLLDRAVDPNLNQVQRDAARAELREEISERIGYYVNTARANQYLEIDVYNESSHTGATDKSPNNYWNAYGAAGVADIYNEVAEAVQTAGSSAKIYTNEYNVFQWGDEYANWYRRHVEELRNAGGTVTGIGFQYYADPKLTGSNIHSAARMQKALAGLSLADLPLALTEFGLSDTLTTDEADAMGPDVLEDSMRMMFGTPQATSFLIWGWWDLAGNPRAPAALLDNTQGNAVLTPMGLRWEELMKEWDTELVALVDANGAITFNGFYGDYELIVGGRSYKFTLEKGTAEYVVVVPEPASMAALGAVACLALCRRRRNKLDSYAHDSALSIYENNCSADT